ncbi:glycosyltransferase [Halobacillus litoralis]|uniref:glycosyltransferase n=1 Tax=Halobacillus litoralis TaxID=45668 RepID=UPI00136EA461|nr:glycosyltransferase [Halobacillus litoralis]
MKKDSIIMIGPLPPPIGGVSVHISRLKSSITEEFNIYTIDTSSNRFIQFLKLFSLMFFSMFNSSRYIVHNHTSNLKTNYLIIFLCRIFNVKYIQTFHSFRIANLNKSYVKKELLRYVLRNSEQIIAVSEEIKNYLIKYYMKNTRRVIVQPAFIPYYQNETTRAIKKYKSELQLDDFISSHNIIICANASRLAFHEKEDLYGIDMCIELVNTLIQKKPYDVGCIIMLPQIDNREYYVNLKTLVTQYGISNRILFVNKNIELVPLLNKVDIFVRPTNTDGDALSVRESLHSLTPTIASDVVKRPDGTITFKSRDTFDFYKKVVWTIENYEQEVMKLKSTPNSLNTKEKYTSLYRKILMSK